MCCVGENYNQSVFLQTKKAYEHKKKIHKKGGRGQKKSTGFSFLLCMLLTSITEMITVKVKAHISWIHGFIIIKKMLRERIKIFI